MNTLSIIIPAYNEASRLPRTVDLIIAAIADQSFKGLELKEILVIDDGSTDQTWECILTSSKRLPLIKGIAVSPNQGKGNAVHCGLRAATGDWCLVADADSATPWNQFLPLLQAVESYQAQVAIGSRGLQDANITRYQTWIRRNMGKTFNWIVRTITGLPFQDTQCGFKLIKRSNIQSFIQRLSIKRFAWDVEFLMFSKKAGLSLIEVAVSWEHQDASRVRIIQDSLEMLYRVCVLKIKLFFMRNRDP
jgi:dolichyl-phosphate beta-glucosyltransferase